MQDGLLAGYTTAANVNGAWLAKVGEAWRTVWTQHPEISLNRIYDADCKHPKEWGTYLAASVIYVRLTGRPVRQQDSRGHERRHSPHAAGDRPAGRPALRFWPTGNNR